MGLDVESDVVGEGIGFTTVVVVGCQVGDADTGAVVGGGRSVPPAAGHVDESGGSTEVCRK